MFFPCCSKLIKKLVFNVKNVFQFSPTTVASTLIESKEAELVRPDLFEKTNKQKQLCGLLKRMRRREVEEDEELLA